MSEYLILKCDQCGEEFEIIRSRVIENSDIVFCRKRCYIEYLLEWGDEANSELLQALPGDYPDFHDE